SITPLEGPNDWIRWERQITEFLGFSGYGRYLAGGADADGPRVYAEEAPKDRLARQELWEQNQDKALWAIKSRCGTNAKATVEKETSVAAAFSKLRARYRPTGSAVFQSLHQTYKQLTLDSCNQSISEYAERLRTAKVDLEALDTDCKVPQPFFVDQFLSGLTNEYTTFLATFHQTHSLITQRDDKGNVITKAVTFDEAVMAAERFEQGLKAIGQKEIALVARVTPRRRGPCSHCGHRGHHDTACFLKHPHLRERWEKSDRGKQFLAKRARRVEKPDEQPESASVAYQQP
ncbi:hypothetical protein J3E72DRAFT_146218, partial [Bipolaris maydis]